MRTRIHPRDKQRSNLWSRYRMRLWQYDEAIKANCCKCCERPYDGPAYVDHDHACDHYGKGEFCCRNCIRGVICGGCNSWIGKIESGLSRAVPHYIAAYLNMPLAIPEPAPMQLDFTDQPEPDLSYWNAAMWTLYLKEDY